MAHVSLSLQENYKTVIKTRGHTVIADEPRDAGGGDTGPLPYELLLASIGSCTAITMKMYAGRKGWPLEGIEIDLDLEKVSADEVPDYENTLGLAKVDVITKKIVLHGDLTREQKIRIAEIGTRCPVHRTVLGKPHFIEEVTLD